MLEVKNIFKNYDKNDYIKDLYDEMGTFLYKMLSNYINETDPNFFLQTPINLDNINKFNDDLPLIREYKKEIADANSTKAYWCLVKSMDGYDLKGYYDGNYTKYQGTIEKPKSSNNDIIEGFAGTKDGILKSIEELALFYINHISTYQHNSEKYNSEGVLKKSKNYYARGADTAHTYFEDNGGSYETRNGTGKVTMKNELGQDVTIDVPYTYKYPVVPSDETGAKKIISGGNNRILYRNDDLVNYANNYLDTLGTPQYAGYVGDDCNSFAMGVLRLQSKGNRGQEGIMGTCDGLDLQHTDSSAMMANPNFEKSMFNLGYIKYYLDGKVWKKAEVKNGIKEVKPLTEVYNNPEFKMSVGFLEPGDLLCCSGHAEFYIGYEYEPTYNLSEKEESDINKRKKSGIASLTLKGKTTQGHATFGWGGVYDNFPIENEGNRNYYFYYTSDGFKLCYSCKDGHHSECDDRPYKVIWRKN